MGKVREYRFLSRVPRPYIIRLESDRVKDLLHPSKILAAKEAKCCLKECSSKFSLERISALRAEYYSLDRKGKQQSLIESRFPTHSYVCQLDADPAKYGILGTVPVCRRSLAIILSVTEKTITNNTDPVKVHMSAVGGVKIRPKVRPAAHLAFN